MFVNIETRYLHKPARFMGYYLHTRRLSKVVVVVAVTLQVSLRKRFFYFAHHFLTAAHHFISKQLLTIFIEKQLTIISFLKVP